MTRWLVGLVLLLPLAGPLPPAAAEGELWCEEQLVTILGTPGDDDLTGTEGPDVAWLDAGDDTFSGLGGDDVVCSGHGADTVTGGEGADLLLDAGAATDDPPPVHRADQARRGAEDDVLDGGPGHDVLQLSDGADVVVGGEGRDTLTIAAAGVVIDVPSGTITGDGTDSFAGFEVYRADGMVEFFGSDLAEVFIGKAAEVSLGAGDDAVTMSESGGRVDAGDGDDEVLMTAGGEVLGGPGQDRIGTLGLALVDGGAGDDEVVAQEARPHDLRGGTGRDRVWLLVAQPMLVDLADHRVRYRESGVEAFVGGFETVRGGHEDDVLRGTGRPERLEGHGGDDRLLGRGGADRLIGGPGDADRADGAAGRDRCTAERELRCEE